MKTLCPLFNLQHHQALKTKSCKTKRETSSNSACGKLIYEGLYGDKCYFFMVIPNPILHPETLHPQSPKHESLHPKSPKPYWQNPYALNPKPQSKEFYIAPFQGA